jgi:hypothetical protein
MSASQLAWIARKLDRFDRMKQSLIPNQDQVFCLPSRSEGVGLILLNIYFHLGRALTNPASHARQNVLAPFTRGFLLKFGA